MEATHLYIANTASYTSRLAYSRCSSRPSDPTASFSRPKAQEAKCIMGKKQSKTIFARDILITAFPFFYSLFFGFAIVLSLGAAANVHVACGASESKREGNQ